MPMSPIKEMIDKVFFGFPVELEIEFNNDEATYQNKTYKLNEAVDTIDNQIFVSADFYPKVLNHSIGFDFSHRKIVTDDYLFDCELTRTSTLFTKKGKAFAIKLRDFEKNPLGKITIMPNVDFVVNDISPILPAHTSKVWVVDIDSETGHKRRYEQNRYSHYKIWSIQIKDTGKYLLVVENIHEKFTIIVVD